MGQVVQLLRLEAVNVSGPSQWRWQLLEPDGKTVAVHDVLLDTGCWQFEAIGDLHQYLKWHVAPDRRLAEEARILHLVGRWIGEHVFGPVGAALVSRAPVVVEVVLADEARVVAFYPLEAAVVGGRALAEWRVGLVLRVDTGRGVVKQPVSSRLRMLAVFSLPDGASPLDLRMERQKLAALVDRIEAMNGRAVELRILQYGATRERLRNVVEDADGWDILHLSGHGRAGALLLEQPDGSPDLIATRDLVDILEPLAGRVKLVVVSSCSSAALTAAEQLHLLGLGAALVEKDQISGNAEAQGPAISALAVALADRLDCAVLAMRFPVTQEFASELTESVYDNIICARRNLPDALAVALPPLVAGLPTLSRPALSLATPAMFGSRALNTTIPAPPGPPHYGDEKQKLTGFPPQPERFVGRVTMMTHARVVLAPKSGIPGVLLCGMAGAGKTACALELAYTHQDAFQALVWYTAPRGDADIGDSLVRFTEALEAKVPAARLSHLLEDPAALDQCLPTLAEIAESSRVLVVIDNAESLISPASGWRDKRWGHIVNALTSHQGLSRLIVTSQHQVAIPGVRIERVHALSRDEAVLLARDLPQLRALIDGEVPGIPVMQGREAVARVLAVVQGHPKLLELADGQATNLKRLEELVEAADAVLAGP